MDESESLRKKDKHETPRNNFFNFKNHNSAFLVRYSVLKVPGSEVQSSPLRVSTSAFFAASASLR